MSAASPQALPPGSQLNWFTIESVLGQGGFGITYLATDTALGQHVAIKEYLPQDLAYRDGENSVRSRVGEEASQTFAWGLRSFLAEARTLATFDHPNIVRVRTAFEANGTAYMVMDYEDGQTLKSAWESGQTQTEAELLEVIVPIADGLRLLHDAGFIHRDIKPENIYLRENGGPVLLDFGSARQHVSARTRGLTAVFTPGYAPFEQHHPAEGGQAEGPHTDIYALSATLYRGIVGEPPVDAAQRAGALLHDMADPFIPLDGAQFPAYSPALLSGINHGLRFFAKDRPKDVGEWLRAFEGAVDPVRQSADSTDSPTIVRPVDQPATEPKPRRSSRRFAAVAIAALVGALSVGGWWYWDAGRSEPTTSGTEITNSGAQPNMSFASSKSETIGQTRDQIVAQKPELEISVESQAESERGRIGETSATSQNNPTVKLALGDTSSSPDKAEALTTPAPNDVTARRTNKERLNDITAMDPPDLLVASPGLAPDTEAAADSLARTVDSGPHEHSSDEEPAEPNAAPVRRDDPKEIQTK